MDEKRFENCYGCKNQLSADHEIKFIVESCVIPESAHDSQVMFEVLNYDVIGDQQAWADRVYRSEQVVKRLRVSGYKLRINHKCACTK